MVWLDEIGVVPEAMTLLFISVRLTVTEEGRFAAGQRTLTVKGIVSPALKCRRLLVVDDGQR